MNKKGIYRIAPAFLMVVGVANAQSEPKGYSVAINYNSLTSKEARNATKAAGFGVTLGYELKTQMGATMAKNSIELTFNRNEDSGDRRLDVLGLFATTRVPLSRDNAMYYGGIGVGVVRLQSKTEEVVDNGGSSGGSSLVRRSESKTAIAGKILVGANFGKNAFAEVAYNLNGSVKGLKADSIAVSVGVRF